MYDGYEEVFEMAQKLGLPQKPVWYDANGCPRWQEPKEKLARFVKGIRCQACGQIFRVCLVDGIYRSYGHNYIERTLFHGKLPKGWHYGDAPNHPAPEKWGPDWWTKGWDVICVGVTMNSIPEYDWECWEFHGKFPTYKDEYIVEREEED